MLIMLFLFHLANHYVLAKQPTSYGRVYNIQDYITAASNDSELGIKRCLTDIAEDAFEANSSAYTILFPKATYSIEHKLFPVNNSIEAFNSFKRSSSFLGEEVTINILGLDIDNTQLQAIIGTPSTCATPFATHPGATSVQQNYLSSSYLTNGIFISTSQMDMVNSHLSRNSIDCSGEPKSNLFLTSPFITTGISNGPIIESNSIVHHCFFYLRNDGSPTTPANLIMNIMGIHCKGIDNISNSHIYNPISAQHNSIFESCMMINLLRFKSVYFDNNKLENVYGNGLYVDNLDYLFSNSEVIADSNIIKNVWQLVYKNVSGSFDNSGDGLIFRGNDGGKSRYNYIVNDVLITQQNGRVALASCSEYNRNTLATHNFLSGYDRGIHIEKGLGGHIIENNRVTGSESGIVIDDNMDLVMLDPYCPLHNPCQIRKNYFSNENIPSAIAVPHLRKIYPPALLVTTPAFSHSVLDNTVIEENYMVLDKEKIRMYDITNQYLAHGNPNTVERMHMFSTVRRQQVKCNVFETKNADLLSLHSGLHLNSWHANNDDPTNNTNTCLVDMSTHYT